MMKWIKKACISFIILTMLTSFLPNVFSTNSVGTSNTVRISNVGGLVGYNSGVIRNSHATGVLKLKYASVIGGLVGQNEGKIYASSYTESLQYIDDITPAHPRYTSNLDHFGGLVGRQGMNGDGALTAYSYSTTSVGS